MWRKIVFSLLIVVVSCENLKYSGPFLLWGHNNLKSIKSPALRIVDSSNFFGLYRMSKKILIFEVNTADIKIVNGDNFNNWKIFNCDTLAYLPQQKIPLPSENNVDVIPLTAANSQFSSINEVFKQAEQNFGPGQVLGILATVNDRGHSVAKREINDTVPTSSKPTDELMQEDFVYTAQGKAILYTTAAPILTLDRNNTDDKPLVRELTAHGIVTVDERDQFWRLSVTFSVDGGKITLRFKFPISNGYWSLRSVEIVDKDFNENLTVAEQDPSAPVGFSYKCSRELIFKGPSANLTMKNVQVQPLLAGADRFSDAYDCVGFSTIPIWSGILISFLILIGTSIGITSLNNIKAPNRFESNRNKQLTLTVQE